MANKDFEQPNGDDGVHGGEEEVVSSGGPGDTADPLAMDAESMGEELDPGDGEFDGLTVDDILGTEQSADAAAEDAVIAGLENALMLDLKRLQAEYANYRRRTEEQRSLEIERAKGEVAKGLLTVLDDLDRAEQHGDLAEGSAFAVIAEKVRGVATKLGVVAYGEPGEAFDPQQHEAIFQAPTPGTVDPTILEVVETGYRLGSVELRPAKVVVAVPAE